MTETQIKAKISQLYGLIKSKRNNPYARDEILDIEYEIIKLKERLK